MIMQKVKVKSYTRKVKGRRQKVKGFTREHPKKGKKRIIGKKPVKLYPVLDEYGHRLGWSRKRGKK